VGAEDPARKARVIDASKLKEAVGDRYRPAVALVRLLVLVLVLVRSLVLMRSLVSVLGFRTASAAGCMQISN
jgi:cytochrome c-type biogenesis protein CcmH/NrfG